MEPIPTIAQLTYLLDFMLNNNTPKFKVDYNISYEVSKELQTITMYEKKATNLLLSQSVILGNRQFVRHLLILDGHLL